MNFDAFREGGGRVVAQMNFTRTSGTADSGGGANDIINNYIIRSGGVGGAERVVAGAHRGKYDAPC